MPSTIDRAAASRALAKAIAYHQAGKPALAKEWAQRLVAMLRDAGVGIPPQPGDRPMVKVKRAALYLRVSTDGQTTDNQRRVLAEVAERRGWTVTMATRGCRHLGREGAG